MGGARCDPASRLPGWVMRAVVSALSPPAARPRSGPRCRAGPSHRAGSRRPAPRRGTQRRISTAASLVRRLASAPCGSGRVIRPGQGRAAPGLDPAMRTARILHAAHTANAAGWPSMVRALRSAPWVGMVIISRRPPIRYKASSLAGCDGRGRAGLVAALSALITRVSA